MILHEERFVGVHPDLVAVVRRAAELGPVWFIVTEGVRALVRQKQLVAEGKSRTMRSRHLTGHAIDLAVWEDRDADKVVDADEISWKFPQYEALNRVMQTAAQEFRIPIEWGGSWVGFRDGPHWQLPWARYPLETESK